MPESKIKIEILNYLLRHSSARDTLEGIAQWWLLEQRIRTALSQVKGALNELVAQELVVASEHADGQIHYRLNSRKQDQIRALVKNGIKTK